MKILLLVYFSILDSLVYSQGNLQFNQVINGSISETVVSTSVTTMGTIVVPTGKVLKIGSVALTSSNSSPLTSSGGHVSINTHIVWLSSSNLPIPVLPLWLSAGTYNVDARYSINTNSTFSYSAIEFNIIP